MKAGVYARKSTRDDGTAETRSVGRQESLAREFAAARGWNVVNVFVDDEVSAVEWPRRRGWAALTKAAEAGEFEVLIVEHVDRIGRDPRALLEITRLEEQGIQLWSLADGGQQITLDTEVGFVNASVNNLVATLARRQGAKKVRAQLRKQAEEGFVAGQPQLGYRHEGESKQRRRVIDPEQAELVRRIFTMAASGLGAGAIARRLNEAHVLNPVSRTTSRTVKGAGRWSTGGIREILHRRLYLGEVVFGATKTIWKGDRPVKVPGDAPLKRTDEKLRIIPDAIWRQVHSALGKRREVYRKHRGEGGQLNGSPESQLVRAHLLAGFAACGLCASRLVVTVRRGGTGRYYVCTRAHHEGKTGCANTRAINADDLEEAVVGELRSSFLHPATLGRMLAYRLGLIERATTAPDELAEARAAAGRLDVELGRLADAVAAGAGAVPALVERMKAAQAQRDALGVQIVELETAEQARQAAGEFDLNAWMEERRAEIENLAATLTADPDRRRVTLRSILTGPVKVTPAGDGWAYEVPAIFIRGALGEGVRDTAHGVLQRRGRKMSSSTGSRSA